MSPHRKIPGINLCLAFEIGDAVLRKMDAPKQYWKERRDDSGGLCSKPDCGCRVVNVVGWLRSEFFIFSSGNACVVYLFIFPFHFKAPNNNTVFYKSLWL